MYCSLQRFLFYHYLMMNFVFFFQSSQYLKALIFRRFFYGYRLETSFQSRILLNIFPVFGDCRSANQL